jgi:tRNA-Thr(GGU) m(6)t(6)A37 methyltransferase TsaA
VEPITYPPIGVVHTPFTAQAGMPVQTVAARDVAGTIELAPEYVGGLSDLDGFSHLWLLVHLHQVQGHALTVTPYLDDQPRGVFATRSPRRPNPIGLSIVRLVGIDGATLKIEEVDLLDGTPVLDIKPYVPLFDYRADARIGWFASKQHNVYEVRADDRFR